MNNDLLLVPVMTEAMLIGKNSNPLADFTPDYEALDDVPFGNYIMNGYFTKKPEMPGVHLHWIMPDALLHGIQGDNGLIFPRLPNRWIIQRACVSGDKILRKAWLIESDFLTNSEPKTIMGIFKTVIPCYKLVDGKWEGAGDNGKPYMYMGSCRVYGEAEKSGRYLERLSADCTGDPLFTAYYPRCKTVFGFYDNMENSGSGSYTYVLSGYYSNDTHDPLYKMTSNTLESFKWRVTDAGAKQPAGILCYSILKNVEWRGADVPYPSGAPLGGICVTIGNTSAEALSKLVQDKLGTPGFERIFNALQYGALGDLDNSSNPDALLDFEELLHERQFYPQDGGNDWKLRAEGESEETALTDENYKDFQNLNEYQKRLDSESEKLMSVRNGIFFAWYRYYVTKSSPFSEENAGKADEYLKLSGNLITEWKKQKEDIGKLNSEIEKLSVKLTKDLSKKMLKPEKNKTEPSYRANAPALLFSGEGVQRAYRQGFQADSDGYLSCRINTVNSFTMPLEGVNITLTGKDISALCEKTALPEAAERLMSEAISLTGSFARPLALCAYAKKQQTPTEKMIQSAMDAVLKQQASLSGYEGTLPCFNIAVRNWKQPWSPLVMHWGASIIPARTKVDPDDSLNLYKIQGPDFKPDGPASGESVDVQGSSIITPHAVIHLYDMLMKLIEDYGESGKHYESLKKAAQTIKGMDALSQRMDGFNEILIMRDNWPFLPVSGLKNEDIIKDLTAILNSVIPLPHIEKEAKKFLPVRAGFFNLVKLWIIDSFGQVKEADIRDVKASESMYTGDPKKHALLLPRFNQACLLDFRWLNHKNENFYASDAATSPVFGFVVPNFLDVSLQIYDENGKLLGFVQKSAQGVKWMTAFGSDLSADNIKNPHLRRFVHGLLTVSPNALTDFLNYLDKRFNKMIPLPPEPFLSLCFGNVIALARACVSIEGAGLAPCAQDWNLVQSTHYFEKQAFNIKIGDVRKTQDGFIGFFTECDAQSGYNKLFIPEISGVPSSGYLVQNNKLKTSLAGGPQNITLLLELSGYVTFQAGFLPACRKSLEANFYRHSVKEMEMMFRLSPLLTAEQPLETYLPGAMEDTWLFAYQNRGKRADVSDIRLPSVLPPAVRPQAIEGYMYTLNKTKKTENKNNEQY